MTLHWTLVTVLAVLLVGATPAGATSWETKRVASYYNAAEIVARVQIVEGAVLEGRPNRDGKRYLCAGRYKARVLDLLKGDAAEDLVFYAFPDLSLSSEYLVFLSRTTSANEVHDTDAMSLMVQEEFEEGCRGVVPEGLQSNQFALSEFYPAFDSSREIVDWITPALVTFPVGKFPERHRIRLAVREFDDKAVEALPWGVYRTDSVRFPLPFKVASFEGGVRWSEYRQHILSAAAGDDRLEYPPAAGVPNLVGHDREARTVSPGRRPVDAGGR